MASKAIATFVVLLAALNYWGWQVDVLGYATGAAYLGFTCYLLGGRFGAAEQGRLERLAWGGTAFAAAVALTGAAAFYLWRLTPEIVFGVLALLPWLGRSEHGAVAPRTNENQTLLRTLGLAYVALAALTLVLVADANTVEAIRTPWQVVPPFAFVSYALTVAAFLVLAKYTRHPGWFVPVFFTSLSVLALVYPLGFGFDPFIHQASEKLIQASGTLTPKPLYYVGQYALVVTLAQLTRLPLATIDTWIVPLAGALVLPFALWRALARLKLEQPWQLTLPLVTLVTLGATFTYTTPQALANLAALVAVLLMAGRTLGEEVPQKTVWLVSLAACVVHPLTGLPLLGATVLWWLSFEHVTLFGVRQGLARGVAAAATALAVPLAFIALSWLKPGAASVQLNHDVIGSLARLGNILWSSLPALPHFTATADVGELARRLLAPALVVLSAIGWRFTRSVNAWRFFAWVAAMPATAYLMMTLTFTFPNLPPNEQGFYSERLWMLALTFVVPLALAGAYTLGRWVLQRLPSYLPWVVGTSLALTAGFYLTYPRFDRWHRDTAYNTTPADVAAVQLIEETSGRLPYVVVANQAVAAAAIHEFGFAHYYQGHFYYPIPTGTNPLYEVYLAATERGIPTRGTLAAAAAKFNVPQVYLVLNRYWADFLKLAPVAQKEANQYWQVADDRVQVFRYDYRLPGTH